MLCPDHNCGDCPRLAAFRAQNRAAFPDKFNAPVPSFGPQNARLLIVGLAPGLRGANFSGRPFTGDYAGDLLYATLLKFGLAKGVFDARADDGLELIDCRITNAVRCVPPENKPTGPEIKQCQPFLEAEFENLPNLQMVLSLGLISHNAVVRTCGEKLSAHKFTHGAVHNLSSFRRKPESSPSKEKDPGLRRDDGLLLFDSYHCSRYNTNTRRLTTEMFEEVFASITDSIHRARSVGS